MKMIIEFDEGSKRFNIVAFGIPDNMAEKAFHTHLVSKLQAAKCNVFVSFDVLHEKNKAACVFPQEGGTPAYLQLVDIPMRPTNLPEGIGCTKLKLVDENVDGCGTDVDFSVNVVGDTVSDDIVRKMQVAAGVYIKENPDSYDSDGLFDEAVKCLKDKGYEVLKHPNIAMKTVSLSGEDVLKDTWEDVMKVINGKVYKGLSCDEHAPKEPKTLVRRGDIKHAFFVRYGFTSMRVAVLAGCLFDSIPAVVKGESASGDLIEKDAAVKAYTDSYGVTPDDNTVRDLFSTVDSVNPDTVE